MRICLPSVVLLLALAACAAHPPRCGHRLTPINPQPIRPAFIASRRVRTVHSTKVTRS